MDGTTHTAARKIKAGINTVIPAWLSAAISSRAGAVKWARNQACRRALVTLPRIPMRGIVTQRKFL